jgi:hypothetical protein
MPTLPRGLLAGLMIRLDDVTRVFLNPEYVKSACHDNLSHILQ